MGLSEVKLCTTSCICYAYA
jgi:hypothetical protein